MAEADIAKGGDDRLAVIAGGGHAQRITDYLDALAPGSVLSFGLAGGLAPRLRPGAAYVADGVVDRDGQRLPVDASWAADLSAKLDVPTSSIIGVDQPLADAAAKSALHRTSGASLVDMESHIAAAWAARRRVPFAALRVVSDPAERSLPHAATVGMRSDGTVDVPAVLVSLVKGPWQLPGLIRTGLDARAAFATLLGCRQRLGVGFARLDL